MARKRRKFQRPVGKLRYRKLFVIAVEGKKTEPQYFSMFNNKDSVVKVKCIPGGHASSPPQVLKRIEDYLKQEGLKLSDEAWIVVDKDQWTDEQLERLHMWSRSSSNYGFALSNPKFEYWLLLHFEEGTGITTSRECSERLKRYLSDYDKGIDVRKFSLSQIHEAVHRAKLRDTPPCTGWPRTPGATTVYKLIEKILQG